MITAIGERDAELAEERPGLPGQEGQGHEDRGERRRRRDDREEDLPVPSTAAARGPMPAPRRRTMFSSTTMASSTTRPVASTSASRVRMLTEKPAT